jgi:hypothetical protein
MVLSFETIREYVVFLSYFVDCIIIVISGTNQERNKQKKSERTGIITAPLRIIMKNAELRLTSDA